MEADHDKAVREGQARENVSVRWDVGLNRKKLAFFSFPRDEAQLRLAPGASGTLSR